MPGTRRPTIAAEAERQSAERCARLGGEIRAARKRRRWTQAELARRANLGRTVIGRAERAVGPLEIEVLDRIAVALGVPLAISLGRDPREDVADAGHLEMQELVLRMATRAGFAARFEMPTRPAEPWRSSDVGLGKAGQRVAVDVECWNTIGDIGGAARASNRKVVELERIAVARWGADARATLVWVVRDTARNHELVARYPEVFANRFPGSSIAWVRALTEDAPVPVEPGLVWCDLGRARLHPWRRPGRRG